MVRVISMTGNDAMADHARTTVTMARKEGLASLIYAVKALSHGASDEPTIIDVVNSDGMSLIVNFEDHSVFYGKAGDPEAKRRWTDNVGLQQIIRLCMMLQRKFYDEIDKFEWTYLGASEDTD